MLALAGSLLLSLISTVAVSGTSYNHVPTTTTTPAIIAEHASEAGSIRSGSVDSQNMASGQARALFGLSRSSVAPRNADDLLQQSRKYLGDGELIVEKPASGSDLIIRTKDGAACQ